MAKRTLADELMRRVARADREACAALHTARSLTPNEPVHPITALAWVLSHACNTMRARGRRQRPTIGDYLAMVEATEAWESSVEHERREREWASQLQSQ